MRGLYFWAGLFALVCQPIARSSPAALFVPGPHHTMAAKARNVTALLSRSEVQFRAGDGRAVRMRFEGTSNAEPEGLDPLAARLNFLLGSNRGRWRTGVPVFARARYRAVWRGIDVTLYGREGSFEYDFTLRPGADVQDIKLRFTGTSATRIENGDIVLSPVLRQLRPRANQDGREVRASYVVLPAGRIGIELGPYDHTRPVVIDPAIVYATYLGGGNQSPPPGTYAYIPFADYGNAIAVDAAGNAYITGKTEATDFPVTLGAYQRMGPGAFIAKIDPTGSKLIWATYLGGGSPGTAGQSIAVDASGAVYVTGVTYDSNFPITPGAALSKAPSFAAFASKLSPDGSRLIYSTYLPVGGSALAIDGAGNTYIAGGANSTLTATPGVIQSSVHGNSDAVVLKLNPAGTAFVWAAPLGGSQSDGAQAIAIDSAGNIYIAGTTYSSDFPVTPGAPQATSGGGFSDGFIAKLNPNATKLLYSTYLGGKSDDSVLGIAIDSTGSAYVTGTTRSTDFPVTPGAFRNSIGIDQYGNIYSGAFVAKLDPAGTKFVYSTILGGDLSSQGAGIAVDSASTAFVTGITSSLDFPTTSDAIVMNNSSSLYFGLTDAFLTRLDQTGQSVLFSTRFGGSGPDSGNAIALGPGGDVYLAGATSSADLPVTPNALQPQIAHGFTGSYYQSDAFIARIAMGDISVFPSSLKFDNLTPHAPFATAVLNVTSWAGSKSFTGSATSDTGWSSVSGDSATPGIIRVTASPAGLAAGSYRGSVSITSPGAKVAPAVVPVALVVANIQALPNTLSFSNDNNGGQVVRVTGGSGIYFSATTSSKWIHIDIPYGVTPARLNISVDPTGLGSGVQAGSITVTPKNAPADSVMVAVTLNVP
jgi:hypothetical protein